MALVHSFLSALTICPVVKACDLSLVATLARERKGQSEGERMRDHKNVDETRGMLSLRRFWLANVNNRRRPGSQAPKTPVALLTK